VKVQSRFALAGLLHSRVTAIEILQNRVRETQNEIDTLEDLHGTMTCRPRFCVVNHRRASTDTAVAAAGQSQCDRSAHRGDL
jgi:hypothetical protein